MNFSSFFFFFMLSFQMEHIKATEAICVWCAFISKRHIFVIGLQFKLYSTLQTSTYLQMIGIIIGKMVALNVYSHDDEGFFTD